MTKPMSTAEHTDEVLARFDHDANPRLVDALRILLTHVHAAVEEMGLTRDEWFEAIQFLTAVGQKCDDVRQEFILLSDTMGVSMLVEMINQDGAPGTTEPTVFGPFHVDGAPERAAGASIVDHDTGGGTDLTISGRVVDLAGAPIAGAKLDVWQTAPNGLYSVQEDAQPLMNLRGIFTTDADGRYALVTQRPVDYTIPDDGPVGAVLAATGRDIWRPAHVHFLVSADGYKPVTTHLFDRASAHLHDDVVFGVRDSLIVDMAAGSTTYDFVLERA
jgi:protocatechuate 3,4-dioxygenase beta subunit